MFASFRLFSQKFPRLTNCISSSLAIATPTGLALYTTNRIKDPKERELALEYFMDVDGHKEAQARARRKLQLKQ
jgi:hypothetical protein